MTDGRFKELAYLYLDREISPRDFQILRSELANEDRKRSFESLRRIHMAEKQALAFLCDRSEGGRGRESLTERAFRAINEARIHFEERRKGLVLLGQFTAATATIAVTVGLLYQNSVESVRVEPGPDSSNSLAEAPPAVRERLIAQLQSRDTRNNTRLILDQTGRALAIVSYVDDGEVQVQALQSVPESNIFKLGRAIEAARPQLPDPAELLEQRNPTIPVRYLPGTTAPIVLVNEEVGPGAIVGYAY